MNTTKAIITDAGIGSRFLPLSKTIPKVMIPLLNRPIIEWVVLECLEAGITDIIIVTNKNNYHLYKQYFYDEPLYIKNLLQKQNKLDRYKLVDQILDYPKITIILQDNKLPYGNGAPIYSAKKFVQDEDSFIVCQSDDIVIGGENIIKKLTEEYSRNNSCKAILATQETTKEELINFGVVKFKDGNSDELDYIVERPQLDSEPSNLVSYGRYLLTPMIFKYLKPEFVKEGKEFFLVDALSRMARDHKIITMTTNGKWVTTGDPVNYLKAQILFALNNPDVGPEISQFLKQLL